MNGEPWIVAAAIAGLVASPHCLAMCGPLAVAGCSRAGALSGRDTAGYLGGRLCAYATAGAVLGSLGARAFGIVGVDLARKLVIATLALLCVWRGVAALRARSDSRPVELRTRPRRRLLSTLAAFMPRRGLGLGLATALLPCGALAAGGALAAATAHPVRGALAMALFSLTSLPGLGAALLGRRMLARLAERLPARAVACAWFGVALLIVGRLLLAATHTSCH